MGPAGRIIARLRQRLFQQLRSGRIVLVQPAQLAKRVRALRAGRRGGGKLFQQGPGGAGFPACASWRAAFRRLAAGMSRKLIWLSYVASSNSSAAAAGAPRAAAPQAASSTSAATASEWPTVA